MSSMRGNAAGYQYPPGSRSNTQPMNFGSNQTKQEYSIPPNLYVERRPSVPLTPVNRPKPNNSNTQNYSIPQSFYVERRSTNPVPVTQPNQPQYIEPNQSNFGYQNARAVQDQVPGMYHHKNPGTPSRNVNPALVVNPPPYSLAQYATYGKESLYAKKETRAEIDDAPIIDPSAFRYLNLGDQKVPNKGSSAAKESGIDSRPIINLDAVTQLERRRQQQIEKNNKLRGDDGTGPGIDSRSMVDPNAFRHIEAKTNKIKGNEKQGQDVGGGIDTTPITNPDAFKYLEARNAPRPTNTSNEPTIDTRPIINPDAFKYIEKRRENSTKDDESGIDYKPIVNPEAFRYLEQRGPGPRREGESGVDTRPIVDPNAFQYIEKKGTPKPEITESSIDYRPIVNPNAFQYIEKKGIPKPEITESSIDYRPIVNPQAFKWIEGKQPKPRADDGPDVDERSYVSPQAFQYIDRPPRKKTDICEPEIDTRSFILDRNPNALTHLERESRNISNDNAEGGIDERSYVNPNSFRYLEGISDDSPKPSIHSSAGPAIDTKSYVNPNSFRHLEGRERPRNDEQHEGIDERPFVPPTAFRHLEFTGESTNPGQIDYSTYGQSDL